MKVLVVGTGSIARRHAANLRTLVPDCQLLLLHRRPIDEVDADLLSIIDRSTADLAVAVGWRPDAAVVANAAPGHVVVAIELARHGIHLLIEKPLGAGPDGVDDLVRASSERRASVLVGYCLRFHEPLRRLRQHVRSGQIGTPLSFQAEVGQFLPEWRPGIDYRTTVSARSELGGGAILELSHEIDCAIWMMGPVRRVGAIAATFSELEVDVEDVADLILRFDAGGSGAIHLDFVQRPAARSCKIVGSEGTVVWNGADDSVRTWRSDDAAWVDLVPPGPFDHNRRFLEELRHFLSCVDGADTPEVTLDEARHVLDVCIGAKQSAAEGRFVSLPRRVEALTAPRSI